MVHLHVEEGREDSELWIGSVRMGNGMVKVCSEYIRVGLSARTVGVTGGPTRS